MIEARPGLDQTTVTLTRRRMTRGRAALGEVGPFESAELVRATRDERDAEILARPAQTRSSRDWPSTPFALPASA